MDQSRSIPPIPPQATPEELNRGVNTLINDYNRTIGTNKISFTTSGGSGTLNTIKDEGSTLSAVATSIDFVGAGVTATGGPAITVTIPGGGGSTPTGTGFRHVTAGVEDAASKLVDTADINASQVTYAKIQNVSATNRVLGRSTAGSGVVEEITVGGDLSQSGSTFTVGNNVISDAKLRQGVARSVIGVTGNSTANVADIQGTTDQVLRVTGAGTGLSFGAIDLSKTAAATGVLQAASMPALTGDVTNTSGTLATTIANSAVTLAKMANIATATVIGRNTAGTGVPEVLTTIPTGTVPAFTGDVTNSAGSLATTIANNAVSLAKMAQVATATVLGRNTAGTGNVEVLTTIPTGVFPALTGDVTNSAGSLATTIATGAVSLAKMANMATSSLIYRKTAGTGAPEVNTLATLKTDLGLTGTNSGDQTITLTSDVTGSGTGSFATTIANSAVTLAKMENRATQTFIGRNTAGTGVPEELSVATAKTMLSLTGTNSGDQTITLTGHVTGSGTGSFATTTASKMILQGTADATTSAAQFLGALGTGILKNTTTTGVLSIAANSDLPVMTATVGGAVPTPPNNTTTFLRGDGTFATPSTGAPVSASYVTLGTDATLTSERVLTGTANQVVLTDNGAGSTIVLSLPQSIATSSTVQFGKMGVGQANVGAAYYEAKTLTAGGIQGMRLEADTVSNVQFSSFLTGDAQLRFSFLADGTQKWGSGSAVADTNLYRSAVNTLKTDNTLLIGTPGTVALSAATIDGTQTLTNKTATSTTNNITAKGLFSLTTTVDVSGSTAPTAGQALVATSGTAATWQTVTATAPDIALSVLAPAVDETITAGYSAVLVRSYKIESGKKLTIGSGARFRIL
jgi:hypothetical protein